MRRTARWGPLVAALVVTMSAGLSAGDYHKGATLACDQCHIMHYSQSHGYDGGFYYQGPGGPFTYLLRDSVNNLCLSCHDQNVIAPDVLGSVNGGNGPTDVRLAGFLNRLGVEGSPGDGHTLDSLDVAPGSSPAWSPEIENGTGNGLNCTNCHQQHGYAGAFNTYRNLKGDPGNHVFTAGVPDAPVTYNDTQIGTFDPTVDVFERQAAEYDEADMDWAEPDNTNSAIGFWCAGCHTNFHGTADSGNIGGEVDGIGYSHFERHPVAGVNIGDVGGGHSSLATYAGKVNKVKVMSESGDWSGTTADVTVTCISCHKAHGNANPFGLLYRSGTGDLTENGDTDGTGPKDLCSQCHVQG